MLFVLFIFLFAFYNRIEALNCANTFDKIACYPAPPQHTANSDLMFVQPSVGEVDRFRNVDNEHGSDSERLDVVGE